MFSSKCDFYAMSSPSASVPSILCRLHQQVCLLCCVVSISKCDFYAVPALSASITSMLCHLYISKYHFYAVRLYQQVWLLCCAVSISKCDFYAVSSPSASVTSVVSSSSSNVTSILCRLHQQVWLKFFAVSSASAGVTSMLCRVCQQVWLVCHVVCVSKRDFYAVPCSSASVSSMLCRLCQQAFMPDGRGCRQVNVIVEYSWTRKTKPKKKNVRLWEKMLAFWGAVMKKMNG